MYEAWKYRIAKFSMFRGRRRSSPLVSPSMLLLEWIPCCERITRVCIYTGVVRFELRRSASSSNCATIRNRRHNCIAISWKRGPLTNWSVHVFRSVRVFQVAREGTISRCDHEGERFRFSDFILIKWLNIINYLAEKRNNSVYLFSMLRCFKCCK